MREEPADSTKPIEFFRVPVRRMFKTQAAAQYLGLHPQTLRRLTDEGKLKALNMDGKMGFKKVKDQDSEGEQKTQSGALAC